LESTQKELAERADLTFEFNEIKYGRRVDAINFRIFSKDPLESLPDNEQINPSPTFVGFLNNALKADWEHDGFSNQSAYEKFMSKKQMMESGYENLLAAGY